MRLTTAFNRLLALPGITVSDVAFGAGIVTATVALRRRRLCCPRCDYSTRARHDTRPGARFTRDFEDLVAFLATKTDKTTITRLLRIDWDTVGRICARVVADGLTRLAWTGW